MKIKLAILEKDSNYLKKISSVMENKYVENIQIFIFTDQKLALQGIESNKIDVFLAYEEFEVEVDKLPKRCGFAYLTDSSDINEVNGYKAIHKFQKTEAIYKEIVSIYAEVAANTSGVSYSDNSKTKLILFTSPAGGVGTSTMAVSCAKHFGRTNKVMYLCLDPLSEMEQYFNGNGTYDFSEIIFALKSQNTNLGLKIEGTVRSDESGVDYFASTRTALDMTELSKDDITKLIDTVRISDKYDYVILDMPFSIRESEMWLYELVGRIVITSDGSEISNGKIVRAINAMTIMQDRKELNLLAKMVLVYNKFSNKLSKMIESEEIKAIGGVQKYEHATNEQIVAEIQNMQVFENIR